MDTTATRQAGNKEPHLASPEKNYMTSKNTNTY